MDPNQIAGSFLEEYYKCQSNNKEGLFNFYTEDSCLSYNGDHCKGLQAIKHKIMSLTYKSIEYKMDKDFQIQPGPITGSIILQVNGKLCLDGESSFEFIQVFQLCPNSSGGYYCKYWCANSANDQYTMTL